MGAIAEGFVAYAQILIDQTDGSVEQLDKAMSLAQLCFNLALLPTESRLEMLLDVQHEMAMSDAEFEQFRQGLIDPMIRRHEAMFPLMHRRAGKLPFHPAALSFFLPEEQGDLGPIDVGPVPEKPTSTIDRYAPCSCGSGKKYKFCCGRKPR